MPPMELPQNAFKRALKAGKADAKRFLECGALFVAVGADVGILARGAEALRAKFNV